MWSVGLSDIALMGSRECVPVMSFGRPPVLGSKLPPG